MLEFSPIIKSLWRSKIGPLLIVIQLALSIAIVSNALFFIAERTQKINRESGIAHSELSKIWVKQGPNSAPIEQVVARDLDVLNTVPGVTQSAPVYGLPFGHAGSTSGFSNKPHGDSGDVLDAPAAMLQSDHRGLPALGLNLVAGRNFHPEEIEYFQTNNEPATASVIITQSLADRVFPDKSPLGQTLYLAGAIPLTVVGVTDNFLGYFPDWEFSQQNALLSAVEDQGQMHYVIRSAPEGRHKVMHTAIEELRALDANRIVGHEQTMEAMMTDHYSGDYAMIVLLSVVIGTLVFINMLGIVGITTFWVNQRRKQIGIRRALGATRSAIMRYFLVENGILVVAATAVGAMMAFWASHYLVLHYGQAFLPWQYVPLAGAAVLVITLAASAVPASRAAHVSPQEAVANR